MITCLAAAKVNLDLRVTERRADGYHELDSLVVFPSVGDVLTFEPAQDLTLQVDGPNSLSLQGEAPEQNLVLQAAHRLRAHAGVDYGARITLTKNLPVAAGLGGGSADAAACLSGLTALWKLSIGHKALMDIGLGLGADVPVCLASSPCYLTGIGETVEPIEAFPTLWMVLINPGIALSTPQVFAARKGGYSPVRDASNTYPGERGHDLNILLEVLSKSSNDLETAAVSLVPQIDECLSELRKSEGCLLARMSGSGASCFGLFAAPEEAAETARAIKAVQQGWWVADGKVS